MLNRHVGPRTRPRWGMWLALGLAIVAFAVPTAAIAASPTGAQYDTTNHQVAAAGGHLLLAETSSHSCHAQARQFFLRQGFRLVGDVPDFYREGESRLTYAKYLADKETKRQGDKETV